MKPTPAETAACKREFLDLADRKGYAQAVRLMGRRWSEGRRLAAWQQVQTERRAKQPTGQDVSASAEAVEAAQRWTPLHDNTALLT